VSEEAGSSSAFLVALALLTSESVSTANAQLPKHLPSALLLDRGFLRGRVYYREAGRHLGAFHNLTEYVGRARAPIALRRNDIDSFLRRAGQLYDLAEAGSDASPRLTFSDTDLYADATFQHDIGLRARLRGAYSLPLEGFGLFLTGTLSHKTRGRVPGQPLRPSPYAAVGLGLSEWTCAPPLHD
jgi:hypothetical protein